MFSLKSYTFLMGCIMGYFTQPIFMLCDIYTGQKAIDYYGEVHQSKWNSVVHTIGMPFTYHGILLFVPGLLQLTRINTELFQIFIYPYFVSYYMTLNLQVGILVALCYYPSQILAMNYHKYSIHPTVTTIYGIMVTFTALMIQEFFGHWFFGDKPSRLEGIPNAIWHAGFYSIWHIFYS